MYALALLVNNGINGNRSFTSLTVTDNQLTLSSSNRNHGVNRLDTGLKGGVYGFSLNNTVCHTLNAAEFLSLDGTLAVNRLSQSIDHAAGQGIAYRNLNYAASGLYNVAFTDAAAVT